MEIMRKQKKVSFVSCFCPCGVLKFSAKCGDSVEKFHILKLWSFFIFFVFHTKNIISYRSSGSFLVFNILSTIVDNVEIVENFRVEIVENSRPNKELETFFMLKMLKNFWPRARMLKTHLQALGFQHSYQHSFQHYTLIKKSAPFYCGRFC